jgi:HTH-type transcriptional regulator, sugar sensing transcriptional regulator
MDLKIFEEIGFTRGEVKVYFALLSLGESTIGPLSKNSGITPAKTYPILDKLKKKGLITSVIKGDIKNFQAFNTNRILNYMAEKKKKLQNEEKEIREILPKLAAKQKKEAKYSATVYESMNGLKTLYDEMIEHLRNTREDFIAFTLGKEYEDPNLMRFFDHYDLIRKKEGIKTKLIGVDFQKKFFNKKLLERSGIEIKYLPYASVPQGVIIVGDRVATMVWGENPVAFVIHEKNVAEAYKKFFQDMWKIAKH